MKLPSINGLLLLLNLTLVGGLIYLVGTWPDSNGHGNMPTPAAINIPPPAPTISPEIQVQVVTNDFRWAQLESEDYPTYIQRLRSIGCPEQTIRDIIISDLDKLLAPRVQAIYGRKSDMKYWNSEEEERANNQDPQEWQRQEKEIDRQKQEIVQALIGVDLVRERLKAKGYEDYYERRLSWLPEDKRSAVRRLLEKYDEQEQQIRAKELEEGEQLGAADYARLDLLRQQRKAELASVLDPQQQQEYELWLSPTANTVRYSMYGMNATEQEFLSIYALRKSFDEQWPPEKINWNDPAAVEAWQQGHTKLEEQVRQALGENRFLDYKRGEDPDFHHLNSVVTRYKLPREKALEAYEIKRTVQQMSAAIRADDQLTEVQREEALKAMAAETDQTLRQLLGNTAYRQFQRQAPSTWVGH